MVIFKDEEGSALATVLSISVIVLVFIGAVLLGIQLQLRFIQRDINRTKALYKAEAQIARFLADTSHSFSKYYEVDLDSLGSNIKAKAYGGFLDIKSTAFIGKEHQKIQVLVGEQRDSVFNYAIVLGDSTSGLSLTGTTRIKGDVLASEKGVRSSSFRGIPFSGKWEGDKKSFNADQQFPDFITEGIHDQMNHIKNLFVESKWEQFSSTRLQDLQQDIQAGDTLFFNESVEWQIPDSIRLPGRVTLIINGNALIEGEVDLGEFTSLFVRDTLRIPGNLTGENLLVYAGKFTELGGNWSLRGV